MLLKEVVLRSVVQPAQGGESAYAHCNRCGFSSQSHEHEHGGHDQKYKDAAAKSVKNHASYITGQVRQARFSCWLNDRHGLGFLLVCFRFGCFNLAGLLRSFRVLPASVVVALRWLLVLLVERSEVSCGRGVVVRAHGISRLAKEVIMPFPFEIGSRS